MITALVIMSGCALMTTLRPETTIGGYKPWLGVVTVGGLPAFGMFIVFMGLLADIADGMAARFLKA